MPEYATTHAYDHITISRWGLDNKARNESSKNGIIVADEVLGNDRRRDPAEWRDASFLVICADYKCVWAVEE